MPYLRICFFDHHALNLGSGGVADRRGVHFYVLASHGVNYVLNEFIPLDSFIGIDVYILEQSNQPQNQLKPIFLRVLDRLLQ